jgi:WD40 repeat protein
MTASAARLLHHLRRRAAPSAPGPDSDAALLDRFVGHRTAAVARVQLGTALLSAVLAAGAEAVASQALTEQEAEPGSGVSARAGNAPQGVVRTDHHGDPLPEGVLARVGTARLHHNTAAHLFFTADGKTLVSAGRDRTLRSWDPTTGALIRLRRLDLPPDCPTGSQPVTALSANGTRFALVGLEHLHFWDTATGKEVLRVPMGQLAGDRMIRVMAFSPDGKTLALGNDEPTILLLDTTTAKEVLRLPHQDRTSLQITFSPDGRLLAAAGSLAVTLWHMPEGRQARTLQGGANALAFSPDGKFLVTRAGISNRLWDTATGQQVAGPPALASHWGGNTVAFSPDGRTVALGGSDTIVLWDLVARREVRRLTGHRAGGLWFSPDSRFLATVAYGCIRVWDVPAGKLLSPDGGHESPVQALSFSADGRLLATAAFDDSTIRLWEAATGRPLRALAAPAGPVHALSFSAEGDTLACGGRDLRLLDWRTGKERGRFLLPEPGSEGRREEVRAVQLAPDGRRVGALGWLWDTKTGRSRATVTVWDAGNGKRVVREELDVDFQACLSPDGKRVGVRQGKDLVIHDIAADRQIAVVSGHTPAPAAFSPDGTIAAIGGMASGPGIVNPAAGGIDQLRMSKARDEAIKLWEVSGARERLRLPTGMTWFRDFTPDGRLLLTAGPEDLRLWELVTGAEVWHGVRPERFTRPVTTCFATCLAIAPDGRSAATGLEDGTVLVWDLAPGGRGGAAPKAGDLDALWSGLAGPDAARAYRAAAALIAAPGQAIPFLRQHVPPDLADGPRIAGLIADLDSEQFTARERARRELEALGGAAGPALRKALASQPSAELRRSAEALLQEPAVIRSPEVLRRVRAVRVLEQIGTAEARQVLEGLAGGADGARVTQEAKAAVARHPK